MGAIFAFVLSLISPVSKLLGKIEDARIAEINAVTERQRIAAQNQQAMLAAILQVRLATASFGEMRVLTFMIAFPMALHVFLIGIGTCIAAPTGWGWLAWSLHIPPFPAPFVEWEGIIILSFFGVQGGVKGVSAIAAAIASKHTTPVQVRPVVLQPSATERNDGGLAPLI